MRYLIVAVLASVSLAAQSAPPDSRFEVASIKPRTGEPDSGGSRQGPGEFIRPDITLRALIRFAYDVQEFQIAGGPEWLSRSRFDVRAKLAAGRGAPVMRVAVRHLLEERFALRIRRDAREQPVFILKTAHRDGSLGPRLQPSALDCESFYRGTRPVSESPVDEQGRPLCTILFDVAGPLTTIHYHGIPMSQFVPYLASNMGRQVIDQTGLTGKYDVSLTFSVNQLNLQLPARFAESPDDIPISRALVEQLGLDVDAARAPVEVLTIESVEPLIPD